MLLNQLRRPATGSIIGLVIVLCAGCSVRESRRPRPGRVYLPPPAPQVIEQSGTPDVPLTLAPYPGGSEMRRGSSYGLDNFPSASPGASNDIRYPGPRGRLSQGFSAPIVIESEDQSRSAPTPSEPRARTNRAPAGTNGTPKPVPMSPTRDGGAAGVRPGESSSPAKTSPRSDTASGVPNFTEVEAAAGIAAGGKPSLDGLKWLKERGFTAVLDLTPDLDRDQAEATMARGAGLDYFMLPVTESTLDVRTVEEFNSFVDDARKRPIYIHDASGTRAGTMWYLRRVLADESAADAAKRQAARIGLKDSDRDWWLVISRVIESQRRPQSSRRNNHVMSSGLSSPAPRSRLARP